MIGYRPLAKRDIRSSKQKSSKSSGFQLSANTQPAKGDLMRIMETDADGATVATVIVQGQNITRRKQARRMLQKSEQRYRLLFENSLDGIYTSTPEGKFIEVNPARVRMLGYESKEDLLSFSIPKDVYVSESDRPGATQRNRIFRTLFKKKDSARISVEINSWVFFDEKGEPVYYENIIRDITKRERLEERLRQAEKMEAIGRLSGGIAHDFNNILAVILVNVELAMDDVSKGSRLEDNLDDMYEACLRAREMVKQILTFCREGDQKLRPLSLGPVVKESIKFLRATIPSTIEIRENVGDTDLVTADPTQIGQVVINLCANAAHAMGDGPGILDISVENITIDHNHKDRYRVSDEGQYVKMKVSDTGCGMAPRVISRAFDPYFTTKKEGDGSGMGLAVVHGIVENHGGAIWVNSKPGKGSTFHLLFPVAETGTTQEINSSGPVIKGNERILLVDDEEALLKTEMAILERLGYEVTGTTSPLEALKVFREQPDRFDLVYTDMTMPHMTGLTLAKKLMEIRPHLPVILYSGRGDLIDNDEIDKSGIRAFLAKPVLLEDLALTFREVLENEKRKQ